MTRAAGQTGDRRLADAGRGGHLVLTVGGSPVPVLLTLLGLRPERVTALASSHSHVVWQRVWSSFLELDPQHADLVPRVLEVPATDLTAATQAVLAEAATGQGPVHLGYSGGSAAMSAGAFLGWWRATGRGSGRGAGMGGDGPGRGLPAAPGAWYVAEQGDALVRADGCYVEAADILGSRNLSLAAMVRLHGLEPAGLERRPDAWQPHLVEGTPAGVLAEIRRLPVRARPTDLEALRSRAQRHVLDALALIGQRGGADLYPRVRAVRPADGDSVDSSVDLALAAVRGLSLRLVEVASYRRAKPTAAEITRAWGPGPLKEALFDAAARARTAGGMHAGAALVSLEPPRANRHPAVELLWRDTGPLTTPTRLGSPAGEGEPALPAMTAFAEAELAGSLLEVVERTPLAEGNDLTRWLCGVTE